MRVYLLYGEKLMNNNVKSEEQEKKELIEKLKQEFDIVSDIDFNEFTIQEKLKQHAFLMVRYGECLERANYDLEKLKELKEKITGERYHYYRFNYDEGLTKIEIEKYYLVKDEKILKINNLIRLQKVKVDFFNICCKAVDKMG